MRVLLLFCLFLHGYAGIEDHYKKMGSKTGCSTIRNVDYVYMINLDQRPEKWESAFNELAPYWIWPERFSGIYGWTIPPEVLNDIGLKFQHGMWTGYEYVMVFPPERGGEWDFIFLRGSDYGKACFSGWTVKGTIGCSLSHLSVLKDGYDSGYNTIWILEDDISVRGDPHRLSQLIDELDALVGPNGWDVLYTDSGYAEVDDSKDIAPQIPWMWRPDMPFLDLRPLVAHSDLGEHFVKIGSRMRAHSMIYRRSGMKKILDFYREHQNFLPYDQEMPMVPGIQLFVLKEDIVTSQQTTSDTRYRYFSE